MRRTGGAWADRSKLRTAVVVSMGCVECNRRASGAMGGTWLPPGEARPGPPGFDAGAVGGYNTCPARVAPGWSARMKLRMVGGVVCVAAALAVVGCAGKPKTSAQAASYIRSNPTPELDTLYQRPVDVKNALAVTDDTNGRMILQDLGRAMYTDRPSRLTWEPIPR